MDKKKFRRLWTGASLAALALGAVLNGIAWMQARAMTHYVEGGVRTDRPEALSTFEKMKTVLTGVQLPRPTNQMPPDSVGLAYETHRISLPNDESLEMWFVPTKETRGVVLLFPAYGSSKQLLFEPSRVFHTLGYDVMLTDYRGVGGSSGNDTTLGVREGEDVAYAVRYVEQTWSGRPIILYGASLGAASVMRAIAHEGINPAAVILESPFDRLLGTVRHRFEAMGLPSFPSAELIVFWGGQQQGINGFSHNPVTYAKAIACPVLLLHGEADTRVTLSDSKSIYQSLPGEKQFAVFPSIGHGALVVESPEKWTVLVQNFLQNALEKAD